MCQMCGFWSVKPECLASSIIRNVWWRQFCFVVQNVSVVQESIRRTFLINLSLQSQSFPSFFLFILGPKEALHTAELESQRQGDECIQTY